MLCAGFTVRDGTRLLEELYSGGSNGSIGGVTRGGLNGARCFEAGPSRRLRMGRILSLICATVSRGKCGPIGRVIKCVVSKSPACVADRGNTEDVVVGMRHSRLMRRLLGRCVGGGS